MTDSVADIRIAGVPAVSGTVDKLLREWFGYSPEIRDGEWYIPGSDPALRSGPPDVLNHGPRLVLDPSNFASVAEKLAASVPSDFDEHVESAMRTIPWGVKLPGEFGLLSEIHLVTTKIAVSTKGKLARCLADELLPLFHDKLKLRYVVPVSLNSSVQQGYFSFAKLAALAEQDPNRDFKRVVEDLKPMAGLEMPAGYDVLLFVDALTRLVPVLFTWPVRRHGCTWHFYGDGFATLPHLATHGLFQDFIAGINPRTADARLHNLHELGNFREDNIWRLIRQAVIGVNRLMAFLNDHRTFRHETGAVDFTRQLKCYGAVRMAFADLLALNFSMEPHSQITFAYGFLDKLANLKKDIGGFASGEGTIATNFASLKQGKELKRLYRIKVGQIHPDLARVFLPVIGRCYWGLHRHLGREVGISGKSESKRLTRFRAYRNLNHGLFLDSSSFDEMFLDAQGTVPPQLGALPYLLALGFVSDPHGFLKFDPT